MSANFQQQKSKQLARKDKSDKGDVDRKIASLLKKINAEKEYYTTSSCAGRIILLKAEEKKKPNLFLFRTHEKISLPKLKKALNQAKKYSGLVYFKQEPCILHVACFGEESAKKLLQEARNAGWKRSGMITAGKRVVCELMSTEHIELPVMDKGKNLVDNYFLKILVREANKKLERTWEKIAKFEKSWRN